MAKLITQCSIGEIARYEQAYLASWDTINDCILYIEMRVEDQSLTPSERLELQRDLRRHRAEIQLLEAKRQGFRATQRAIRPPDKTKVEEARQLAKDSDEAIKNSETADALITLAIDAVRLFNSIQEV